MPELNEAATAISEANSSSSEREKKTKQAIKEFYNETPRDGVNLYAQETFWSFIVKIPWYFKFPLYLMFFVLIGKIIEWTTGFSIFTFIVQNWVMPVTFIIVYPVAWFLARAFVREEFVVVVWLREEDWAPRISFKKIAKREWAEEWDKKHLTTPFTTGRDNYCYVAVDMNLKNKKILGSYVHGLDSISLMRDQNQKNTLRKLVISMLKEWQGAGLDVEAYSEVKAMEKVQPFVKLLNILLSVKDFDYFNEGDRELTKDWLERNELVLEAEQGASIDG